MENYQMKPVYQEFCGDLYTPVAIVKKLKEKYENVILLESKENVKIKGKYTYILYDNSDFIRTKNGMIETINGVIPYDESFLDRYLEKRKCEHIDNQPDFVGGFVGYISYAKEEDVLKKDGSFELLYFDKGIVIDNEKEKMYGFQLVDYHMEEKNIQKIKNKITNQLHQILEIPILNNTLSIESMKQVDTKEQFIQKVDEVIKEIQLGKYDQVVLANKFYAKAQGDLFELYRQLRIKNPSPYLYYVKINDLEIAASSPETMVRIQGSKIATFPLAGTRRRGITKEEENKFIRELQTNVKEIMEHEKLVELSVEEFQEIASNVEIEEHLQIKKYSEVMHLESKVVGTIENKSFYQIIKKVLPAGTLSGYPKKSAMNYIDKLENFSRDIYGGAIGYISLSGNMDLCIAIRMAVKKNDEISVCAGCGIVKDSISSQEYQETVNKSKAIINIMEEFNDHQSN